MNTTTINTGKKSRTYTTEHGRIVLRDTLYNLMPRSGASDEYCQGLTVGLVSGLMATGLTFKQALLEVVLHLPRDEKNKNVIDRNVRMLFPEPWHEDIVLNLYITNLMPKRNEK